MKARNWFLSMGAMTVLFLTVSLSAWAQSAEPTEPAPPPPPHHGGAMFERMGPGFDGMGFVGFEAGLAGKTVTGAPFSASFSTQTTETLTDGNKIERNTTGTIARDTAGRTRRDMTLPAIGPWAASGKTPPQVSFINDPVAGTHYVLEANTKTAHQMSAHNHGPDAGRAASMAARVQKNTTTESLGTQTINGVSAQGTRTTRTIPAGEMGNEKPIVIVKETWYSPELQITVMTKRTDPRMGETVSQVTNIQRQEPAATLFQVPSDYTVKQGRGGRNTTPPLPPAEE
ncbi:MAG: hypothetical protein WCD43_10700 [Candidatus Acidiferrales bacterium]